MPIVGSSNRIFTITVRGLQGSQEVLSKWHYRQSILLQTGASVMADEFENGAFEQMRNIQTTNATYGSIEVIDNMDASNFFTKAINKTGARSVISSLPAFLCVSIRLLRSTRDLRSGWKRVSGINEEDTSGGTFVAGYLSTLDTYVPGMADPIIDVLAELPLCIIRDKPSKYTPNIDPQDPSTWYYTDVLQAQYINRLTTQNTRKSW